MNVENGRKLNYSRADDKLRAAVDFSCQDQM